MNNCPICYKDKSLGVWLDDDFWVCNECDPESWEKEIQKGFEEEKND